MKTTSSEVVFGYNILGVDFKCVRQLVLMQMGIFLAEIWI